MLRVASTICALVFLAACGGGGGGRITDPGSRKPVPREPTPLSSSDPEYHLETARFTTHQPQVLEQIGAHHAYAEGLTGRGVRIGIDDTIVDYTQTSEFGSRVKTSAADGASLVYDRPDGDLYFSDVDDCQFDPSCSIWTGNSREDPEAVNDWTKQIIREAGWPTRDDSVFLADNYFLQLYPLGALFRWKEVPTPYGRVGSHGTITASVAAGMNLGVAPEATIVPIARNLTGDQAADEAAWNILRNIIAEFPTPVRSSFDDQLSVSIRDSYTKFDIINRSYGVRGSVGAVINEYNDFQWASLYLPQSLRASLQSDVPDAEKTIIVYAAGNDSDQHPGLGAGLPFFVSSMRGHTLSVVATDPGTGAIADYSNRCGSLPSNWNSARHGPHYCLAAPGTVQGLVPNPNTPSQGYVGSGMEGTSFAAPVVSGALALLMEHFRGTRGNTVVVRRMLDTANRSGRYADLETYGAGFLDLEAALSPVGTLNAGQSARALSRTTLYTPAAFGPVVQRAAGIELAVFDSQDFPFWIPVSSRIVSRNGARSPIPVFDEGIGAPAGLDVLGQRWTALGGVERLRRQGTQWVAGFGPTSASLTRWPRGRGWGYGLSFDNDKYLGSRTSGAFGSDLRSGMAWASRRFERELDATWRVEATGTVGFGAPHYEKNAIFEASPSLLSAMSFRIGTENTGFVVEQPLRAETGRGTFRVESGRIHNGQRLYDEYRIRLRPDARELRMTIRHEREAGGGRIAFEFGTAMNAGHATGERESSVGVAFRRAW